MLVTIVNASSASFLDFGTSIYILLFYYGLIGSFKKETKLPPNCFVNSKSVRHKTMFKFRIIADLIYLYCLNFLIKWIKNSI